MNAAGDYAKQIHPGASPQRVFDALTTGADFAARWAPAAGSAAARGEWRVTVAGIADPLGLQVAQAKRPPAVTWNVRERSFQPDWVGATAAVTLGASGDRTELTSCVSVDSSAARPSKG
jgi:hypothetical protein